MLNRNPPLDKGNKEWSQPTIHATMDPSDEHLPIIVVINDPCTTKATILADNTKSSNYIGNMYYKIMEYDIALYEYHC